MSPLSAGHIQKRKYICQGRGYLQYPAQCRLGLAPPVPAKHHIPVQNQHLPHKLIRVGSWPVRRLCWCHVDERCRLLSPSSLCRGAAGPADWAPQRRAGTSRSIHSPSQRGQRAFQHQPVLQLLGCFLGIRAACHSPCASGRQGLPALQPHHPACQALLGGERDCQLAGGQPHLPLPGVLSCGCRIADARVCQGDQ